MGKQNSNYAFSYYEKLYGLQPMTFSEEMNAPHTIRSTRQCKIEIVDMCRHITKLAEYIAERARRCPEEDDAAHAELVTGWRNAVETALIQLDDAEDYGKI